MELKNILVIRTDRIGDVVLTLPMFPVLKKRYPSARTTFMVREYTKELVSGHPDIDDVVTLEECSREGLRAFFRRRRFDAAVVARPRIPIAYALWLGRVPVRVGTGYRWYSLFFNKRVYEHRKDAAFHEAEYNLHLLRELGCSLPEQPEFRLPSDAAALSKIRQVLRRLGINEEGQIVVLHPGSGGSARDWPADRFGDLGGMLLKSGLQVVVTGSDSERGLCDQVSARAGGGICNLCGEFSLRELSALYGVVGVVVANSTGPIHIAAAAGTPVVGLYPPIIQCSPQRWGPVTEKKRLFVPDRNACTMCQGGKCRGSVCMEQITAPEVCRSVVELLQNYSRKASVS